MPHRHVASLARDLMNDGCMQPRREVVAMRPSPGDDEPLHDKLQSLLGARVGGCLEPLQAGGYWRSIQAVEQSAKEEMERIGYPVVCEHGINPQWDAQQLAQVRSFGIPTPGSPE